MRVALSFEHASVMLISWEKFQIWKTKKFGAVFKFQKRPEISISNEDDNNNDDDDDVGAEGARERERKKRES